MRLIEEATVLEHVAFGGGYRRIVFRAPNISRAAAPGQFVHVRIPQLSREALRRPFSIYRADGDELHVMYKPVGRGTHVMEHAHRGDVYSLIGPLGHGFSAEDRDTLPVCVAGGYGVAPLSFLAKRMRRKGVVFIGARAAPDILCTDDFASVGWDVHVATEDGSLGERGLITDALDRWIATRPAGPTPEIFACGPEGLMRALTLRAEKHGWQAWLSLDRPMGCGIGACLSCVQRLRGPDGKEYWARCCTEGPVFAARELVWEHA
ncbi:MAG: dihydroorotate dehydrogenase electron transfer subunit [Verrucomicrobia bacterium]|nr:dihydroorotate dehydrogenase electron transfer subunit [Verrucomicrobiota bacterium]